MPYLSFYIHKPRTTSLVMSLLLILQGLSKGYSQNQNKILKMDSVALMRKSINAIRISVPPKIDAVMDESFWQSAAVAGDFVEYSPKNGSSPQNRTEVRFAYDDLALYAFATMFDPQPDSIAKELGKRDQIEQLFTDYISFDILPYNDGLNMYEFKISPAGLQNDVKYSAVGQDISWDAVWESDARITEYGWVAELKIPWSALRFPKIDKQVWGINMWRNFKRAESWSTWCFVDNKSQDIFKYYGTLEGINNIKPPTRLSFMPYVATYVEKIPENKDLRYSLRGGMDLRYGINEAYTLDMMLIPDFGQVQSDDLVLNLSPFEVRYNEKRQFFTEATEMFDKCEIFYSRRVGGMPRNYFAPYENAGPNEVLHENPELTRIINATKLSGRNSKGLGLGFFNAMTTNTKAVVVDTTTGIQRKIMTQPFTNYNVVAVDQNLKNNSYITLINTNYYEPDNRYTANVSGLETQLNNKKRTLNFLGRLNVSQKFPEGSEGEFGHQYLLSISKPTGRFQYQLLRQETGDTYDPNDMGFLLYNNEAYNRIRLSYNIADPFWKIRYSNTQFFSTYSSLVAPNKFTDMMLAVSNETSFQNFWYTYVELSLRPMGRDDYYEPRTWGKVYKLPLNYSGFWMLGSDSRKKFRYVNSISVANSPDNKNFSWFIEANPRYRFSDRFMISLDISYNKSLNDYGWVNTDYDIAGNPSIFFGRRDVSTFSNVLDLRYVFNTKLSLTLRGRHYWSQADYLDYYILNDDGSLSHSDVPQDAAVNFNAFNADLVFAWYFAPGSELSMVWKNAIYTQQPGLTNTYWHDLRNTLEAPQSNGFSIRVLYYLDSQYFKKWLGKV